MSIVNDDLSGFGALSPSHGLSPFASGQEVILGDSGTSSAFSPASAGGGAIGHTPSPTLISAFHNNLAIDLIWDSSVAAAPKAFIAAVDAAAELLVSVLHTPAKTTLYIDVGWGEVAGFALTGLDLGESASLLYTDTYADVATALTAHGDNLAASAGIPFGQLLFTSAEGKALGLVPGTSGGVSSPDGAIGFATLAGTGFSWQFGAAGTGPTQFNMQAAALHELTEVMGRFSSEGTFAGFYTPLDLFDFAAPGALSLSPAGGYFSINNGVTQMGQFNNAVAYGGDINDWASFNSPADSRTLPPTLQDPFDAFGRPGFNFTPSLDDLLVMKALGY